MWKVDDHGEKKQGWGEGEKRKYDGKRGYYVAQSLLLKGDQLKRHHCQKLNLIWILYFISLKVLFPFIIWDENCNPSLEIQKNKFDLKWHLR